MKKSKLDEPAASVARYAAHKTRREIPYWTSRTLRARATFI